MQARAIPSSQLCVSEADAVVALDHQNLEEAEFVAAWTPSGMTE